LVPLLTSGKSLSSKPFRYRERTIVSESVIDESGSRRLSASSICGRLRASVNCGHSDSRRKPGIHQCWSVTSFAKAVSGMSSEPTTTLRADFRGEKCLCKNTEPKDTTNPEARNMFATKSWETSEDPARP